MIGAIGAGLGAIGVIGAAGWATNAPAMFSSGMNAMGRLTSTTAGLASSYGMNTATALGLSAGARSIYGVGMPTLTQDPGSVYDPGYTGEFASMIGEGITGAPRSIFTKTLKGSLMLQTLPRIRNLLAGVEAGGPLTPIGLRGILHGGKRGNLLKGMLAGTIATGSPIGGALLGGQISKVYNNKMKNGILERRGGILGIAGMDVGSLRASTFNRPLGRDFARDIFNVSTDISGEGFVMRGTTLTDTVNGVSRGTLRKSTTARRLARRATRLDKLVADATKIGTGNFFTNNFGLFGMPFSTLGAIFKEGFTSTSSFPDLMSNNKILKEIEKMGRITEKYKTKLKATGLLSEEMLKKVDATGIDTLKEAIAGKQTSMMARTAGVHLANIMKYKYIWDGVKGVATGVVNRGLGAVKDAITISRNIGSMEFGTGRSLDTQQGSTERSRAISAMQNIGISARSYLGNEAQIFAQ